MNINEINVNDLLTIIQETVDLYSKTRWITNFKYEHIGEQVRYGGVAEYEEFGSKHILAFQSGRGTWHTPNCPPSIIVKMRETYLMSIQESDNA